MYLNKKKISFTLVYAKVQLIVGIVFVVFWGFGVIGGLADYENMRSSLSMYILLTLPFIWLVWLGLKKKRMVEKARLLNQVFSMDADGEIQASQLAHILNSKDETEAVKIAKKLIGKGFLIKCTIEQEPFVHVILHGAESKTPNAVDAVKCPYCGASVEKRAGFSVTCPYCGSKV